MPRIIYRGSRAQLLDIFRRQLPQILEGRGDQADLARGLQLRLGVVLLGKIQTAFIVKSRGGTGGDGIRWPALDRKTVAQRRTTRQELRQLGAGGRRVRGLLTPEQDRRWRAIFRRTFADLVARYGLGEAEAKGKAAAKAWAVLKAEGAQTKLEVLGGRQVDMLRDTGRLLRSFSPGVDDQPSGEAEQIFTLSSGAVTVGTNVEYASPLHRGIPGRLPARPFWPADGSIPDAWWPDLLRAALRGMAQIAARLLQS